MGVESSCSDVDQGSTENTDHMIQKGIPFHMNLQKRRPVDHLHPVQGPGGCLRTAARIPKGSEVMRPHQEGGRCMHALAIKRPIDMKGAVAKKGRWLLLVEEGIPIPLSDGGETGVKVIRSGRRLPDHNIARQMRIQDKGPLIRWNRRLGEEMRNLPPGVDTGIGSTRTEKDRLPAKHMIQHLFHDRLDGRHFQPPLPPMVGRTVIFDRQSDGVHLGFLSSGGRPGGFILGVQTAVRRPPSIDRKNRTVMTSTMVAPVAVSAA